MPLFPSISAMPPGRCGSVRHPAHRQGLSPERHRRENNLLDGIQHSPRERLFDSFLAALAAFDLEAKPVEGRNVYTIGPTPEPDVTLKLNSGRGSKGTFLFLGSTMYRQDEFPYPTHQDASGFWYATVPKSVSDSMTSPDDSPKDAKL